MSHCHHTIAYPERGVLTSYHYDTQARVLDSAHFLTVGMQAGDMLSYAIAKNGNQLFITCTGRVPEHFLNEPTFSTHTLRATKTGLALSLDPPVIAWLDGYDGYFVTYGQHRIVLTRFLDARSGPCAKQEVVATLFTPTGGTFVGTNRCYNPQPVCPRDIQGMGPGEGYHLCQEICQQPAHAEVDAIRLAGKHAKHGLIVLTGHQYACGNCQQAAHEAHVKIEVREPLTGNLIKAAS
jgi:hypothetical protein